MGTALRTLAFLHTHGLEVDPKDLDAQVKAAVKALQSFYFAEPGQEGLTAPEMAVARSGGLDPAPAQAGPADPLLQGVVAFASLLRTGLTTLDTARRLGVSDARIRQRLQDHSLLALRDGRSWKLPVFQFTKDGELPGWGEVAQSLPREVSPVVVAQWLLLVHPDLAAGAEGAPMSPRQWLLEGRPAHVVAALASELA